MSTVLTIGDLRITRDQGGNPKHNGFWHRLFCRCMKDSSETVLCNPPIIYHSTYWECGYWEKETHETIRQAERGKE